MKFDINSRIFCQHTKTFMFWGMGKCSQGKSPWSKISDVFVDHHRGPGSSATRALTIVLSKLLKGML